MSTAVQLVNRLRRLMRHAGISTIVSTDELTTVCLDLLNEAKRDILEAYEWDFDERFDGELVTRGDFTGTCNVTYASALAVLVGIEPETIYSTDCVARLVVTGDTAFGDTAFRIASAANSAANVAAILGTTWPGTTGNAVTSHIVFDEYIMPSTVRRITAVKHQEDDLRLEEVNRSLLDRVRQRPHEATTNAPEFVSIGGEGMSTYDADTLTTGTRGLIVKIEPACSDRLAFNYSYYYRHPTLSLTQDLNSVPATVEDLIVRMAYARSMMTGVGNEPQAGSLMEREVMGRALALHNKHKPAAQERIIIGPNVQGRVGYGFGTVPRTTSGL